MFVSISFPKDKACVKLNLVLADSVSTVQPVILATVQISFVLDAFQDVF